MIVRKILSLRIIVRVAWRRVLTLFLISSAVFVVYELYGNKEIAVSTVPASILGIAIAFLIGFRVNSAYERWWEARKIWGAIVNDSRTFARQVLTFFNTGFSNELTAEQVTEKQKELIYGQIGFVHTLRRQLRKQDPFEEITPFFTAAELEGLRTNQNVANAVLLLQGRKVQEAFGMKYTEDFRHMQIDTRLSALTDAMGACERIKNTVFPRQYSYYSTIFTRLYSYMLPFILVQEAGWMVIPFTILIGFIFFALDSIAGGIENPFENTINDTPMSAICRTIEINLRQMLGEKEVPEPLTPVNGFLY